MQSLNGRLAQLLADVVADNDRLVSSLAVCRSASDAPRTIDVSVVIKMIPFLFDSCSWDRVKAIKGVRDMTGLGLLDAKDLVEAFRGTSSPFQKGDPGS
jgi:ribosomal protein L7/L12